MLHALVAQAATQSEEKVPLVLPVTAFPVVAFCVLMGLLIVTWAFKSVGTRH